jgi:hypothetical protein
VGQRHHRHLPDSVTAARLAQGFNRQDQEALMALTGLLPAKVRTRLPVQRLLRSAETAD